MNRTDYGFVGVGRMGALMAQRLLDGGFTLTVYDTSAAAVDKLVKAGAQAARSPAEVGACASTLFLSLPTPDVVRTVALGAGGLHESAGKLEYVFDCSTTGPAVAREVAAGLAPKRITYVDCPVSGGLAGAKNGTLAVMVSGPRTAYDQTARALERFGKLFYVGDSPGLAHIMKLCNNILAAAAIVLTSEAMALGVKAGLDAKLMLDIINAGSGRNSATQDKFPRSVLPRTFDFGFATGLSYKDVKLCIHEAENMGVPMVAGTAVLQMLEITKARFGADSDFTSIARVVEEWAGVEIKGK
ncbi:MAG TPA: NAD(P)-dependent oxidoreductase [Gammaproteobacteria bacterium]|nr:NAD(P)-dependent oxidoreductase [Gammaproteobacteria bacterium]